MRVVAAGPHGEADGQGNQHHEAEAHDQLARLDRANDDSGATTGATAAVIPSDSTMTGSASALSPPASATSPAAATSVDASPSAISPSCVAPS
jgi:hypothetical protein